MYPQGCGGSSPFFGTITDLLLFLPLCHEISLGIMSRV
jgi:hypothetical protein